MKFKFIIFGLVLILLSSFVSAFDTSGFTLYYTMDDLNTSGSTTLDSSTAGNDGTINSLSTGVTGVLNEAYEGTRTDNQNIYVGNPSNLDCDQSTGCSMGCWVEFDTATGQPESIMVKGRTSGSTADLDWTFQRSSGNNVFVRISDGSAYIVSLFSNKNTWNAGQYYHIVFTWDGSTATNSAKLYIDGVQDATYTPTGNYASVSNTHNMEVFGDGATGTVYEHDGKLDECWFAQRELSASEVTELYNSGNGFNPFATSGGSTDFELTVVNVYNSTTISNFSANFTNTTTTTSITTTNGTIYYPNDQIVDIDIYDIDGSTYFNRSFYNYNTSQDLNASVWQSVLRVEINESNTNNPMGSFNATVGGIFNESNTTDFATFYLNAGSYSINAISDRFFENSTKEITLSELEDLTTTVYFANTINITANDLNYSNSILNYSVITDDGFSNSTTDGNLSVFCSYPSCDLRFNASSSDYVYKNYTGIWLNKFVANLSLAKAFFRFVEQDTLNGIFNSTINITTPDGRFIQKKTDENGYINFSLFYNEVVVDGNYTIAMNGTKGYITPIFLNRNLTSDILPYNETVRIGKVGITFKIYDRETKKLLEGVPINIFVLEAFNVTTDTGTYTLSNITLSTGTKTVFARSDGYFSEQLSFDYTGQDNLTIDFYMLNLTAENTGFVFTTIVYDNRLQQDASVSMYEYFSDLSSYIKVAECKSNVNGECTFAIELNKGLYYFTASKLIDSTTYSTETNPEIILTNQETRTLVLTRSNLFSQSITSKLSIDYSETYVNNVSTIFMDFQTTDNTVTEVCVDYLKKENLNYTSVYLQCVNASASYSATPILLDRSFDYVAQIYQLENGNKYLITSYNYPSQSSFESIFSNRGFSQPIYVWFWIALLVISFLLKSVEVFSIGGIVLSWVQFFHMPSIALGSISALKTIILSTLLIVARRKEDIT